MKLFQIEEPDGSPTEESGPGLAIAVEVAAGTLRVAVSLGGNAEILRSRDGAERVPAPADPTELLLAARAHAEKALARPVTHAVVVAALEAAERLRAAGAAAGLAVTDASPPGAPGSDLDAALLAAARLAEDRAAAPPA
jgi:hypothetical protein